MFHHRAVRGSNKRFKGKSKGKLKRNDGGRISQSSVPGRRRNPFATEGIGELRRNQARQVRDHKRSEVLEKRRKKETVPQVVSLIALGDGVNLRALRTSLMNFCGIANTEKSEGTLTASVKVGSRQVDVTVWEASRNMETILDIAKVSDICLFVVAPPRDSAPSKFSVDIGVDDFGQLIISALKAQGMPSPIGIVQGLSAFPPKQKHLLMKTCNRFFHEQFSDKVKVLPVDVDEDCQQVFRFVESIKLSDISWRDNRSYVLGESVFFEPSRESPEIGTLSISGHLRGRRFLNPARLIHVTGVGDFQVARVEVTANELSPKTWKKKNDEDRSGDVMMDSEQESPEKDVLLCSNPETQDTLQCLMEPDPLLREQSLITEEEMMNADDEDKKMEDTSRKKRLAEHGLSAYQDSWANVVDWERADVEAGTPAPKAADGMIEADGEEEKMAMDDSYKHSEMDAEEREALFRGLNPDAMPVSEEEMKELKFKMSRDEVDFPDEVDTPVDIPARVRFARYRGLANFRTSEWDNREQLPVDYGRIFQFETFAAAQKDADKDRYTGIAPGSHVRVYLKGVKRANALTMCESHASGLRPLLLWGLMTHEHKVSVLHFQVKRDPSHEDPVKGKEPMVFHCGFRRFRARPVYSLDNPGCNKQMVERFLQPSRFTCASVYGQVQFGSFPVLMFRPSDLAASSHSEAIPDRPTVVATGKSMSVDSDKLLIKRILLTGYPIRCHRRRAVVRYMFFRPTDIAWFKPVAVRTKNGLIGHIEESVGTHGYTKFLFNGHIKGDDTVCMSLYKRQYPPFPLGYFQ
eukprot:396870_1